MMAAIALGVGLWLFAMVVIGSLLYAYGERERKHRMEQPGYDWNNRGDA